MNSPDRLIAIENQQCCGPEILYKSSLLNLAEYLFVIPAQAGIQADSIWTPACAGVTIILQYIYGTVY
jgi:hypothetical protein